MDTSTTDRNAQFDADRAGQIRSLQEAVRQNQADIRAFENGTAQQAIEAEIDRRVQAGEIERAGDSRYKVLTGWDANEYFSIQTARRPGELTLVLPESGLDKGTGYFDRPEWHGEGFTEIGGSSDVEHVLRESGLDFEVLQTPVKYTAVGRLHEDPRSFVNYRDDNGDPLGVVGTKYTPFQNRAAFGFLQELVDKFDVKFASAAPMDGGRRCFISVELPDTVTIDLGDAGTDQVVPYVAVFNSHDGSGMFKAVVTPWRPRCKNTERLALAEARTTWGVRHTKSAPERAAEAQRQLGLARRYYSKFASEEAQLARIDMELDAFNEVIAGLYPLPEAVAEGSRKLTKREELHRERRDSRLRGIFREYAAEVGQTAYAAERAVTDYLDHGTNRVQGNAPSLAAARASAILEGADDPVKNRAHALLLQRAR